MSDTMIQSYKAYKELGDREAGYRLAYILYKHINTWIESGEPDPEFTENFWEMITDVRDYLEAGTDLIDLGIAQTAEAFGYYRQYDGNPLYFEFYLFEARLPFFAFFDDSGYRLMKSIDFTEIDFQIYDIIQGQFPHESAQGFLQDNDWVDVWTTMRYLENLENDPVRTSLLENVMVNRKTIHEKLIFLAYLIYTETDYFLNYHSFPIRLPHDITWEFIHSIANIIEPFLLKGELDTAWEERCSPSYTEETIFFLLAVFEVTQCDITPGWIRLLERSIATFWDFTFPEGEISTYRVHQPIQEFTASILGLLPDEDLRHVAETSLIMPLFFENIHHFNDESFQALLATFTRIADLLLSELHVSLPSAVSRDQENEILGGRRQEIASYLGREIRIKDGIPIIMNSDGSVA